jgi:hypothetical protein
MKHRGDHRYKRFILGVSDKSTYMSLEGHKKVTLIRSSSSDRSIFEHGVTSIELPEIFTSTPREKLEGDGLSKEMTTEINKDASGRMTVHYIHTVDSAGRNDFEIVPNTAGIQSPRLSLSTSMPTTQTNEKNNQDISKTCVHPVLINTSGHRIDRPMQRPNNLDFKDFKRHSQRPCVYYHIGSGCQKTGCRFGHGVLDQRSLKALRYLNLNFPCKNGGQCRDPYCVHGHHCQKFECKHGRTYDCKFPTAMHNVGQALAARGPSSERSETGPGSSGTTTSSTMEEKLFDLPKSAAQVSTSQTAELTWSKEMISSKSSFQHPDKQQFKSHRTTMENVRLVNPMKAPVPVRFPAPARPAKTPTIPVSSKPPIQEVLIDLS